MGINFSRVLTLRYGNSVSNYLNTKYQAICSRKGHDLCSWDGRAQGAGDPLLCQDTVLSRDLWQLLWRVRQFDGEWRAVEGSRYFKSPYLYKENGFKERETRTGT